MEAQHPLVVPVTREVRYIQGISGAITVRLMVKAELAVAECLALVNIQWYSAVTDEPRFWELSNLHSLQSEPVYRHPPGRSYYSKIDTGASGRRI